MSVAQLLRVFLSKWRIILIGAAIGLLLAFVAAKLSRPQYVATAQVIVDVRAPETLGAQTAIDQLSPDYLATQLDVLRSGRITRIVVQRLQLSTNTQLVRGLGWSGSGSLEEFLATYLAAGLRVSVANAASRVISVGYAGNSGRFAALVANAFAQAYVDASLDLQAQPARDSADWYQRRAREVQRDLNAAQRRLTERQRELGVTSDTNQSSSEETRLNALSSQLAAAQAQSAFSGARAGNDLPGTLSNPVIQTLQSEIAKLEGQRQQLAQTAGPNNPDYRQLIGQIQGLRGQLAQQQREVQQGSRVAAGQSSASVAGLTQAVARQKEQVIETRARHDEVAVLEQDVRNLQTVYDQMAARRSQLDLLGESTQSNVTILTPATAPDAPAWPRKGLMAIVGLIVGAVLATMFVVGHEILDQRLRGSEDFEDWLGISDLGLLRIGPPRPRRLADQTAKALLMLPFRGNAG
ncbi:GNVR domain-containing protein [Sphingomonas bacterium]|uniref:GNVR domain-containing protein n=1 Tax=Sphingomonas bacterium TaxID=1895847 RepID=UPI001575227C|nr:GNVR domain-containing protein [Sphingomonas bacterium]